MTHDDDGVQRRAEREKEEKSNSVSWIFVPKVKPATLGSRVTDQQLVDDVADGLDLEAVAELRGLPAPMVRTRLRRARARGVVPTHAPQDHEDEEPEDGEEVYEGVFNIDR